MEQQQLQQTRNADKVQEGVLMLVGREGDDLTADHGNGDSQREEEEDGKLARCCCCYPRGKKLNYYRCYY